MKKRYNLLIIGLMLLISNSAFSQIEKFQATYIYSFLSYIEWPASYRTGDFKIGVLGNNPIIAELYKITKNKKMYSQTIKVAPFATVNDIKDCHILFIPPAQSANIEKAINKLSNKSTLIITAIQNGISKGAAINFIITNGKLNFEIKPNNAKSRNIKISSSLSKLATKVY
jgi:hypothetical protein